MAFNSFLNNILGSTEDTVAVSGRPESAGKARNEDLSGADFKQQLQESPNAVLLDVRTAGEFSNGTIPGAINMDFFSPNFAQKVAQLDKGATYFLFCLSGNRSGQACRIMHQMGFDVRNLLGGIGAFPMS